jgi:hypothetical protein
VNLGPPPGPPIFRSTFVRGGPQAVRLPRRGLGLTLTLSILTHVALGGLLVLLSLLSFDPIAAPPLTIRFLAASPPPPRVVPLREAPKPLPPPMKPPPLSASVRVPPVVIPPPDRPPPKPVPPPPKVEPAPALRVVDAAPEAPRLAFRDQAPPRPELALGRVAPESAGAAGRAAEEPELVLLTPGKARPRGPGGGLAGAGDGLPSLPSYDASGAGKVASRADRPRDQPGGLGSEASFEATGLASFLGHKYGVVLIDASRLGQRTSDGSRYSLLVPMLSEAYHHVPFRGAWRAAGEDEAGVASAQVDTDSIAIHYLDGSLHVVVPTRDGLVALYVSATTRRGPGTATKVEEAERALRALRRLGQVKG